MRETPNLDWLRVFAETAATESFALAALRLGVTPGAVSQRIKALESFLRVSLFERYPQGVKLTDAGQRYAQSLAPALDQIINATREITSAGSNKSVRITILPALAQLWLGPKMEAFHALGTNTNVEIWADPNVVDLRTSNFDIAIRHGRPPFPGCEMTELFFDEIVPVASQNVIETAERDERGLPRDVPLVVDIYWQHDLNDWLGRTGQNAPPTITTKTYSLYSMAVEATLQGAGFMIGHTALIGDKIADGRLVPLSELRVPSPNQFYLLTKSAVPLSVPAKTFVTWLLDQAKQDAAPST
ncbi:LysR substrate-binding domain-containing protein [Qipengyuania qiaonensis]|uniref:LysR family transcriptional regulator n=1 Tax=Qipengyuania qiaonensis TaxID=2867240 RepID=A0ABS7J850_9SPHN|nr:LysR substrate-binding domain-containing protein [Qipengyuania qiaonensis]MBX7483426.1 LysR family transcriptional regulator [Qipengyuania qiaonensis]